MNEPARPGVLPIENQQTGARMTNRLCVSVLAATIAFSFAVPALAAQSDDQAPTVATKATKKTVHHHKRHVAKRNVVYARRPAYPGLEPYRSSGFVGQFPGSCAYDRAAGRCMIDLGYGRCVSCDIGGGGKP